VFGLRLVFKQGKMQPGTLPRLLWGGSSIGKGSANRGKYIRQTMRACGKLSGVKHVVSSRETTKKIQIIPINL